MNKTALILLLLVSSAIPAAAANRKLDAALRQLDPSSRLEEVCNLEAMERIGDDDTPHKPDRSIATAVAAATVNNNTIQGKGGAFRSHGRWYQFSFTCKTSSDRMKVLSFDYEIGEPIPREMWEDYGLWQ